MKKLSGLVWNKKLFFVYTFVYKKFYIENKQLTICWDIWTIMYYYIKITYCLWKIYFTEFVDYVGFFYARNIITYNWQNITYIYKLYIYTMYYIFVYSLWNASLSKII